MSDVMIVVEFDDTKLLNAVMRAPGSSHTVSVFVVRFRLYHNDVVPYWVSITGVVWDACSTMRAEIDWYTLLEFRMLTIWIVAYWLPLNPLPATPDR
jgi:hypothetical protein